MITDITDLANRSTLGLWRHTTTVLQRTLRNKSEILHGDAATPELIEKNTISFIFSLPPGSRSGWKAFGRN